MLVFYAATLESQDDEAVFAAFYYEHMPLLTGVGRRFFGESTLVDDALQETWIRIAKNFEKISEIPPQEVNYYLVTIMKNSCRTLLRKEQKYTEPRPSEAAVSGDVPADAAEEGDGYERLVRLVSTMPELYREVLERKFILGESNQEIARHTNMSSNLVAQRIVRGRRLLIDALREEGNSFD